MSNKLIAEQIAEDTTMSVKDLGVMSGNPEGLRRTLLSMTSGVTKAILDQHYGAEADANLISAAPDLLAAAKLSLAHMEPGPTRRFIEIAIAKAEPPTAKED